MLLKGFSLVFVCVPLFCVVKFCLCKLLFDGNFASLSVRSESCFLAIMFELFHWLCVSHEVA